MRRLGLAVLALAFATLPATAQDKKKKEAPLPADSVYNLKAKTLDGKEAELKDYGGKVTLIVNLASQ